MKNLNSTQILDHLNDVLKSISLQQKQNAAVMSMADLLEPTFANKTEVIAYRELSRKELENVAAEYDILLTDIRNIFYAISRIAADNDTVFGSATFDLKHIFESIESIESKRGVTFECRDY